mmetsp:Transcript_42277/g.85553  ORF Transcript_42277/g.85553 Transcript_42277/m.85553 type:complete len:212 (+) Transcript_42277:61-696(+)
MPSYGVRPYLLATPSSPPAPSSPPSNTHVKKFMNPYSLAKCAAVCPSRFWWFGFAPFSTSSFAILREPFWLATMRREFPNSSTLFKLKASISYASTYAVPKSSTYGAFTKCGSNRRLGSDSANDSFTFFSFECRTKAASSSKFSNAPPPPSSPPSPSGKKKKKKKKVAATKGNAASLSPSSFARNKVEAKGQTAATSGKGGGKSRLFGAAS